MDSFSSPYLSVALIASYCITTAASIFVVAFADFRRPDQYRVQNLFPLGFVSWGARQIPWDKCTGRSWCPSWCPSRRPCSPNYWRLRALSARQLEGCHDPLDSRFFAWRNTAWTPRNRQSQRNQGATFGSGRMILAPPALLCLRCAATWRAAAVPGGPLEKAFWRHWTTWLFFCLINWQTV